MKIGDGIIQPLRWYSTTDKQNFRKAWVKNGFRPFNVLLAPEKSILPFQLLRYHNINVVTVLDLYDEQDNFIMDVLAEIPAPVTNHIKIYQQIGYDSIVYYQMAELNSTLPCGLHYLHLSDGTNSWYSELFSVVKDFQPLTETPLVITNPTTQVGHEFTINNAGDALIVRRVNY